MESEPEESQGKVHFPEDQLMQHDSEIIVKREREDRIAVHLGFLQIKHHYEVRFSVKDDMNEDLNFDPLENLHVRFLDVRPSEDGRMQ
ncbi:hypothetical protein LSH36_571g00008 [Paralvinella palmiformis]|uniref:Adipose-secreted signaling protein n=1 Tax=Paralvinella palmiformis TaxID=53620 RepID=A0AAD9MWU5_9ANNE|nr:hypothetical protein LSH36_571g00008 [Paralvinella palmiformis]